MTTRSTWGRAATGWCLALTLGAGVGLTGCFNEDICWKCTSLAEGGVSHIEQAWFDQLFVATDRLTRTFDTIRADFDADALALARTFGVLDPDEVAVVHADFIRELKLVVDADIDAHVEGALAVLYTPPRCKADIPAAVDAQRTCEASHECDAPDLDVSVACLGICEGSCEGECAGERACELESSGDACDGLCAGSCALAGAAACAGTCRGACSGVCTQRDQDGACAGACAGACSGVCESSTPAACEGGCYGACLVDAGSPSCAGASRCRGACDGLCAGVCRGPLRVPSEEVGVRCEQEAVERCRGASSMFGALGLRCDPPALDLQYVFKDSIDASARAAFAVRLGELERRGAAIVQASARLRALVEGELEGEPLYATPPYVKLRATLDELRARSLAEYPEIAKLRLRCIYPALDEGSAVLLGYALELGVLRAAQDEFAGILGLE